MNTPDADEVDTVVAGQEKAIDAGTPRVLRIFYRANIEDLFFTMDVAFFTMSVAVGSQPGIMINLEDL